ncbi:MAG: hypothetical protein WCJ02_09725 [bacterium]
MKNKQSKMMLPLIMATLVVLGFTFWPTTKNMTNEKARRIVAKERALVTNELSSIKPVSEEEFRAKMRDAYTRIKPLHVYGKAVDSDGHPLAGVEIKISWTTAGFLTGLPREHNQYKWVTSGEKGEWTFDVSKPAMVGIDDAKKEGYALERSKSTLNELMAIRARTQKDDVEAIVCMRKKKEEVFLLKSPKNGYGDTFLQCEHGDSVKKFIDILKNVEYTIEKEPLYEDIQVEAHLDASNKCWVISFNAPKGDDDLLVSDELFYEAPEEDYRKEIVLNIPIVQRTFSKEKYLYLRSRNPAVYSRIYMEIEIMERDEKYGGQQLVMRKQSFTNPYGERSLENGERFEKYTFARDELVHDAKKAIQSGSLPKKPENLEAYLEEREKAIRKAKNIPMR